MSQISNVNDTSEVQVFLSFYGYVCRHFKVATVAKVVSNDKAKKTVLCTPFPKPETGIEKNVRAAYLTDAYSDLKAGDFVVLLATDYDSRESIKAMQSGNTAVKAQSETGLHTENNYIVVASSLSTAGQKGYNVSVDEETLVFEDIK